MPDPVSGFSSTYAQARELFLDAARQRELAIASHVHPHIRGAQGEELAIDVAAIGHDNASSVLVLISGTHGAEGFCGSGCQVNLLRDDDFTAQAVQSGVRIVFVHALNPYGFSYLRRTNEDNVDLNRNFRDFSRALPRNAAYAEVHGFMVPATWPPTPENESRIAAYVEERGERSLQAAVSTGQCDYPDGLFYGGVRPAWSNTILRQVLRDTASGARTLAWIDFHTGLGPRGHGEKIYAGNDVAADIARTRAMWGEDVTSIYDGSSTSAQVTGINGQAAYDECPRAAFAGIALEYGTLPMMAVLGALRADQWLANHPDAPANVRAAIKGAARDAFYQDANDWKRMVYEQALTHTRRALDMLQRE